jgi:hypothetical protein
VGDRAKVIGRAGCDGGNESISDNRSTSGEVAFILPMLLMTPQWMAAELEHRTKSGDILLLHDAVDTHGNPELNEDRSDMLLALEQFLERTKDRFRCVTVPELLRAGCPVRVNWLRQKRNRTY